MLIKVSSLWSGALKHSTVGTFKIIPSVEAGDGV